MGDTQAGIDFFFFFMVRNTFFFWVGLLLPFGRFFFSFVFSASFSTLEQRFCKTAKGKKRKKKRTKDLNCYP